MNSSSLGNILPLLCIDSFRNSSSRDILAASFFLESPADLSLAGEPLDLSLAIFSSSYFLNALVNFITAAYSFLRSIDFLNFSLLFEVSCLLATYINFTYEITYSLRRPNKFRTAVRHIIASNCSFNDFIGDMTSCGLYFLNDLLQGFVFHLFENLSFHVSFLKLLASLEGDKVFLPHVKEWILIINRFIS